jgi:hypothetical protein
MEQLVSYFHEGQMRVYPSFVSVNQPIQDLKILTDIVVTNDTLDICTVCPDVKDTRATSTLV